MLAVLLGYLRVQRKGPGRARTRPDALRADKAYSSRAHRELLRGRGVKAVIPERSDQQSIEARVLSAQDDPELVARAESVRTQIEREAETRRQAIAGFFGKVAVEAAAPEAPLTPGRPSRRRNGNGSSTTS